MSHDRVELGTSPARGAEAAEQRERDTRILHALQETIERDDARANAAAQLVRECRHERQRILGAAREELAAHRRRERASRREHGVWSDTQRLARQVAFVRVAQGLGVDTDAVFALNEYERSKIELLTRNGPALDSGELLPSPPPPPPKGCVTSKPPYNATCGWSGTHLEGESKLLTSKSFLDKPTATSGGSVHVKNWDADDSDHAWAYQENGFVTWYKTKQLGPVTVTATVQRLSSSGDIKTENEFGFSDSTVHTGSSLRCGTFHNDLSELQLSEYTLFARGYSGNGDGYPSPPGGVYGGGPFTFPFVSLSAYPANTWIGVYVGTRDEVKLWVNDVSVDVWDEGKYFISQITVCEF